MNRIIINTCLYGHLKVGKYNHFLDLPFNDFCESLCTSDMSCNGRRLKRYTVAFVNLFNNCHAFLALFNDSKFNDCNDNIKKLLRTRI